MPGNQFHYYRRTLDDRVLFGGYDANYHFPGRIDPALEQEEGSHRLLARHFFEIFPQLEGVRFTHRWAGVIDTTSRFTPVFGTALGGRLAYAIGLHGARRRVNAVRGSGGARSRRWPRHRGDSTAHGPGQADSLPARADSLCRRARHTGGPRSGGPHRATRPVAQGSRPARGRLRLLTPRERCGSGASSEEIRSGRDRTRHHVVSGIHITLQPTERSQLAPGGIA